MGQPITVVQKPTTRPGVVRFELNRSLSGMGHERYRAGETITGHRPVDELARRLIDTGKVDGVHIYSNEVTVDLRKGYDDAGLLAVLEDLFLYYPQDVPAGVPAVESVTPATS